MSRVIKFRAWNIKLQDMSINSQTIGEMYCNDSGENVENVIWLQFTGLQDKNGVDIFDQEILEDKCGNNLLVDFRYGSWVVIHEPTCASEREGEPVWDYLFDFLKIMECEAIGNIHTDKHLLDNSLT